MRNSRLLAGLAGIAIGIAAYFVVAITPFPRVSCSRSIDCGASFGSGGVSVFGPAEMFTVPQTAVITMGIIVTGALLSRAVFGTGFATSLGAGIFAVSVLIALSIPSRVTGPPPSIPCVTPGADGVVSGRCVTGEAPSGSRLEDRAGVVLLGIACLLVGIVVDRRFRQMTAAGATAD